MGGRWKSVRPSWVFGRRARGQDDSLGRVAGNAQPGDQEAETAFTFGGSQSRSWVSAVVVLLLGVAIAGATGYGITRIHRDAAERRKLQALLGQLEIAAWQQSALEWQAVAEQRLSPATTRAARGRCGRAAAGEQLRSGLGKQPRQVVRDRFNSSTPRSTRSSPVDQGRVAEAEEVDEQGSIRPLPGCMRRSRRQCATSLARSQPRAGLGTHIIPGGRDVIAALVWGFQRARSSCPAKAYEALQHQALHDGLKGSPTAPCCATGPSGHPMADRELVPAACADRPGPVQGGQ